ncbi:MAG: hypothetical protein E7262_06935 [Lachnospiraceae bacterium]|nr:hypothetical protein [Lachnospiraceae bacterium]
MNKKKLIILSSIAAAMACAIVGTIGIRSNAEANLTKNPDISVYGSVTTEGGTSKDIVSDEIVDTIEFDADSDDNLEDGIVTPNADAEDNITSGITPPAGGTSSSDKAVTKDKTTTKDKVTTTKDTVTTSQDKTTTSTKENPTTGQSTTLDGVSVYGSVTTPGGTSKDIVRDDYQYGMEFDADSDDNPQDGIVTLNADAEDNISSGIIIPY